MRVTKFNSDGSVNDVREYNVPLPSCVTSFDENQSFLNISFADLEIACQRKNSFEKNNVIEKMRFLISYDYKNYLSSVGNNENAIEIIDRFIGMPINGNDLACIFHNSYLPPHLAWSMGQGQSPFLKC